MSEFEMPPMKSYNRPLWEGAAEGKLMIQRCPSCETRLYPPRSACPECFGDLDWTEADGRGTVHSFTVLHHPDPPSAVDDEDVPVVGAIVELAEGPRMAARLVNCAPEEVEIGADVTATFDETPDGRSVPVFELSH